HPDFEQYKLAKKQMTGAFGLITIVLKARSLQSVVEFTERLKTYLLAVSCVGYESLVIPRVSFIVEKEYDPANEKQRHIRLYFGLEEPQYLINDLEQALNG